MGMYAVDAGRATARVPASLGEQRQARAEKAYWEVLAEAKVRDDAAAFAADIVAALGLDRAARYAPEQILDVRDSRTTVINAKLRAGQIAARARRSTEPKRVVEHGTRRGYRAGCGCDDCRVAASTYNREYLRARRTKAADTP